MPNIGYQSKLHVVAFRDFSRIYNKRLENKLVINTITYKDTNISLWGDKPLVETYAYTSYHTVLAGTYRYKYDIYRASSKLSYILSSYAWALVMLLT